MPCPSGATNSALPIASRTFCKSKSCNYPGLSLSLQVLSPGRETRSVLHDNNQKLPEATLDLLSAPHLVMPLRFLLQTPI